MCTTTAGQDVNKKCSLCAGPACFVVVRPNCDANKDVEEDDGDDEGDCAGCAELRGQVPDLQEHWRRR